MVISPEKLAKARGKRPRSEVAKAVGVSRQQIWHYETGVSEPPLSVLSRMLFLYGVEFQDVIDEKKFAKSLN
jgi:predicted transcriptional regulator